MTYLLPEFNEILIFIYEKEIGMQLSFIPIVGIVKAPLRLVIHKRTSLCDSVSESATCSLVLIVLIHPHFSPFHVQLFQVKNSPNLI